VNWGGAVGTPPEQEDKEGEKGIPLIIVGAPKEVRREGQQSRCAAEGGRGKGSSP